MTAAKHTPGPWQFVSAPSWPRSGDSDRAGWILPHGAVEDDPSVAYVESVGSIDLALIVAAPDLLAALVAALEQTEDGLHQSRCDVPDCWVEQAEAAIAKAKGKPSPGCQVCGEPHGVSVSCGFARSQP